MKDIRVDAEGEFRCWNCGNKGLLEKRTFRSKAMLGVGALLTKKKLKCQTCGEFNDAGNAKPYDGPASRKWRKQWEKTEAAKSSAQRADEARAANTQAQAIASALLEAAAGQRAAQAPELITGGDGFAGSIPPPPPPGRPAGPPPGWMEDPSGRHENRYWDGSRWTDHVADDGVQDVDPY